MIKGFIFLCCRLSPENLFYNAHHLSGWCNKHSTVIFAVIMKGQEICTFFMFPGDHVARLSWSWMPVGLASGRHQQEIRGWVKERVGQGYAPPPPCNPPLGSSGSGWVSLWPQLKVWEIRAWGNFTFDVSIPYRIKYIKTYLLTLSIILIIKLFERVCVI